MESADVIRQHLSQVLGSVAFAHVDRLKRFLRFVVEETISGRGENIKEYSIGIDVFDREGSFDPRTDPIVRVEARRLRARLARYYEEEGRYDEFRIELPKGGYTPLFQHPAALAAQQRSGATVSEGRNSACVLPFSDRSPNGDLRYFCEGISEEIIDSLAKIPHLCVASRSNSQVATIVSGSVRKAGDQLRITVQFVDGASGYYLWSETFDGQIEDTFAVQREIAQVVQDKIKKDVVATNGARRRHRRTSCEGRRRLSGVGAGF
jgi:serine/threonine-protein kinase